MRNLAEKNYKNNKDTILRIGLCFLWPVLLIVAILVKVKMPGGPVEALRSLWRSGDGSLIRS